MESKQYRTMRFNEFMVDRSKVPKQSPVSKAESFSKEAERVEAVQVLGKILNPSGFTSAYEVEAVKRQLHYTYDVSWRVKWQRFAARLRRIFSR